MDAKLEHSAILANFLATFMEKNNEEEKNNEDPWESRFDQETWLVMNNPAHWSDLLNELRKNFFAFNGWVTFGDVVIELQCRTEGPQIFVVRYVRVDPSKRRKGAFSNFLGDVMNTWAQVTFESVQNDGLCGYLQNKGFKQVGKDLCGHPVMEFTKK